MGTQANRMGIGDLLIMADVDKSLLHTCAIIRIDLSIAHDEEGGGERRTVERLLGIVERRWSRGSRGRGHRRRPVGLTKLLH